MKILLLSAPFAFYKGGSELQYSYIDHYLTQAGHDISYLFRYPGKIPCDGTYVTYDYLVRRSYNRYAFTDALKIYNLIRQINPDVVYKRGINYISAVGLRYCLQNNIRFVQHLALETDVTRRKRNRRLKQTIKNRYDHMICSYVIQHAHSVIAQADYQNRLMEKNYRRSADRIIYNFHPVPDYQISKGEKIKVLWVANLKRTKRPEVFIDLANALKDSPAEFIMVGRDPNNEWSRRLKQRINERPNLTYRGELPIDAVNDLFRQAHIFVNTSHIEGFSNTYIQAFMHEAPIVTLNVDPDHILEKNKIGFHSRSMEQLIADVRLMISDERLRNQMGTHAKEYAVENHSLQNAQSLMELIMGDDGGPAKCVRGSNDDP